MDYGSELCYSYVTDNNNSLEIIYCKFCKFTLGVSMNAMNLAANGELGHAPPQYAEKFRW